MEEPIEILTEKFLGDMSHRLDHLAISKEELTPANVEPFRIDLVDTKPYAEKPMRYSPTLTQFIDKEIYQLADKGLIYRSNSSWAAKVILAPKGDTWRMCLNYVGLNKQTRPDRYPLPNIEDVYIWMSGKRYFSRLDLLCGYWQFPVWWEH